jgi:hypothetical protein
VSSVNSEVLFFTQVPSVNDTCVLSFLTPDIKNRTRAVVLFIMNRITDAIRNTTRAIQNRTWQIITLKVSHVKRIFSTEASCLEEKDLGISEAWKFLCNAKAVECQRQLTYNAAHGGSMGFAQRLCYKKWMGHSLGKSLVGRRLGKRL